MWSAIFQAAQLTTFVYQASSAVWNYRWYAFPRGITRPSIGLTHEQTVVHPLVLLSVTDHHARTVQRNSSKRVIGILLGQDNGKTVNVANSFGIPFEEDEKDSKTWFLDHNYIEGMWEMFKKVNGAFVSVVSLLWASLRLSTRTDDWLVPHWPEAARVRPGDQ